MLLVRSKILWGLELTGVSCSHGQQWADILLSQHFLLCMAEGCCMHSHHLNLTPNALEGWQIPLLCCGAERKDWLRNEERLLESLVRELILQYLAGRLWAGSPAGRQAREEGFVATLDRKWCGRRALYWFSSRASTWGRKGSLGHC
jgi:hypothetical protein